MKEKFLLSRVSMILLVLCILLPSLLCGLSVDGITPVNNRDYVHAVHQLLKSAHTNIRVMVYQTWYYEDYPDSDSNLFLKELIEAKKRGVEVWVFMETSNWDKALDEKNKDYAKRLEEGGVTVFFDVENITSHEKVLIVDDYATLVSSNNWSHFSLWLNNEVAAIVWSQPVARAFCEYFNELMEQAGHKPLALTNAEKRISKGNFPTLQAEDVVLLTNRHYYPLTHEAFLNAKERIRVVQRQAQYYTMIPSYDTNKERKPGDPISQMNVLIKDLLDAKKRGVDVEVVLDGELRKSKSTGEWRINNKNEDIAMRLVAGNVTVYYDSLTTQTHAKMVLVDDQAIIGSTNWTHNAVEIGNEASILIKSKEVAEIYEKFFKDLKQSGVKITPGFDLFALKSEMEKADIKETAPKAPVSEEE
jgi:phosphatidylserine/phosphatidylglycerophosphate/cardiolipin synthase-like enzyme